LRAADHFAFEVAHPDDIERAADVLHAQRVEIVTLDQRGSFPPPRPEAH
jgi:hypothetical protein